jgi:pimeloyl-ACP methyl ester carboxylesterase
VSKAALLLVHGGWGGAWVWEPMAAALSARGLTWRAIDCVGYGSKKRYGWTVSADAIADDIATESRQLSGRVLLVGHSSGGMAISRAADKAPELFAGLIYLCAFLPRSGDRLRSLLAENEGLDFESLIKSKVLRGAITLDRSRVRDYFFHDCTQQDFEHAIHRIGDEPIRLGNAATELGSGFERLPKHYIECTEDRVLSPMFQEWMISRQPVESHLKIPTGHMPMYADPEKLADLLDELATNQSGKAASEKFSE